MRPVRIVLLISLATVALAACSQVDSDFFPYKMLGLRSLVSNEDTGQQFEAGFTAASYKAREAGLGGCAAQAATAAAARRLKNWSYICCTVTEKSQCATTVR